MNEHEEFVREIHGGMVTIAIIAIAVPIGAVLTCGAVFIWWLSTKG